jgi:hypothetical protein
MSSNSLRVVELQDRSTVPELVERLPEQFNDVESISIY